MDDVSSLGCPTMAGTASVAIARDASRSLLRWAVVGAASALLFVLALAHSAAVGAQVPYPTTVGTTTTATGTTTTTSSTGYPPNTVVSTYFDARYCNGLVSVVTDSSGHLIDVCTVTGQRIYPVFPDYGYGAGFVGANYLGANYLSGGFIAPGTANGITCNGLYGCPFGGGFIGNGNLNYNYLNGNICSVNNCNAFPAGGTVVGGVVYYNDNRFCSDGKIAFVPGQGYFCQNGGPLVTNNSTTTVNCSNFFLDGCGIYRPFEVTQPTTAPAAAPVAAAPVAAQAAPAAAPAQMPTALTAPQAQAPSAATTSGSNVHVLSASPATAPAASGVGGSDDHR
jgi:hypothetical protein